MLSGFFLIDADTLQTMKLDDALRQAVAHHRVGRLQEAEQFYRGILRMQPNHPDANHNLGVVAMHSQQLGAALGHFQTALEANPSQGQYWLSFVDALVFHRLCGQCHHEPRTNTRLGRLR